MEELLWSKTRTRAKSCIPEDGDYVILHKYNNRMLIRINRTLMEKIIDWEYVNIGIYNSGKIIIKKAESKNTNTTTISGIGTYNLNGEHRIRTIRIPDDIQNVIKTNSKKYIFGTYQPVNINKYPVESFMINPIQ